MKNGMVVEGESNIPTVAEKNKTTIDYVFIEPENATAVEEAIHALKEADAVILGPGSLYTSVIPNLLVKGIANCLLKSDALKLYVSNIMTQPGETDNYDVSDHINAITKHVGKNIIDYVIVNTGVIDKESEVKYLESTSQLVHLDEKKLMIKGIGVVKGDFISIKSGYVRHNSENLAAILIQTIMEKKLSFDRKKIIEYFYLSERLKENKKR